MAFPTLPEFSDDIKGLLRKVVYTVNNAMAGRTNNTGSVTLTASSTTTVITFSAGQIGTGTVIFLSPTTSNAAAAMTNVYQSSKDVAANTITLTHANTGTTDRTFNYALIG